MLKTTVLLFAVAYGAAGDEPSPFLSETKEMGLQMGEICLSASDRPGSTWPWAVMIPAV